MLDPASTAATQAPLHSFAVHVNDDKLHLDDFIQHFWLYKELPDINHQEKEHHCACMLTDTDSPAEDDSGAVQILFQAEFLELGNPW